MKKQVLLFFSVLLFISGFAQSIKLKSRMGVSDQFISLNGDEKIKFNPGNAKNLFGLNPGSDLVLVKTESDKLGFTHYRFYQSYKNIPVDKTLFIAHTRNGVLQSLSGTIVTEFDPNL